MSTFKDFLKEYCPNGVEHKKLGEVFNLRNGYTPSTKNEAFCGGALLVISLEREATLAGPAPQELHVSGGGAPPSD